MKKNILFVFLSIQITVLLGQDFKINFPGSKHISEHFNLLPAKTSATQFRLIKVNVDSISETTFEPLNEITYVYSGDRGGNYLHNLIPFASGTIDCDTSVVKVNTGATFIPTHRILRNYNTDNMVSEELTQLFDLSSFTPYQFETFTYSDFDLDEKVKLEWNGSAYDSLFRNIYTYTGTLLTEKLVERFMTGTWSNRDLYLYSYNAEYLPDTIQIQKWMGGSWQGRENYFFSYNPEGFIEQLNYQQNVGSGFTDYAQIFYTFNSDSLLIKQEQQLYTGVDWVNFIQEDYVYDTDGNLSYFDVSVWDGTVYFPKYRYSFTYETYGEIIAIESAEQSILQIFPNPASSCLYFSSVENIPIKNIQFYNTTGQLISTVSIDNATSFSLTSASGMPTVSGVYYLVSTTVDDRKFLNILMIR